MEQGDQVGDGFVPGEHVGVGGLGVVAALAVDDGVGDLVGDDVHGQAGEDHLPGQVGAGVTPVGPEVAEQHRPPLGIEEGVAALEEGVQDRPRARSGAPAEAPAHEPSNRSMTLMETA